MLVGTLKALFTLDSSGFKAGMKDIEKGLTTAKVKVDATSKSFQMFSKIGIGSITAIGVSAFFATKKVAGLVLEMEALNRRIQFATGSTREAARAYEFIRKESDRLGVSLAASAKQFGALAAAAKGTSMAGEGIKNLFTSIAEISAVMSLNVYDTELVFLAFQQMMSKGKVVSEEVRRQLAERLPGAFAMMARSIGLTTSELDEFMAAGALAATDVLPRFSKQISQELAPAVDRLNESLSVSVNRMKNAWFEMKKGVGESSQLKTTLKVLANVVTWFLEMPSKKVPEGIVSQLMGDPSKTESILKNTIRGLDDLLEIQEKIAKSAKDTREAFSGVASDFQTKFGPMVTDLETLMSKIGGGGTERLAIDLEAVRNKQLKSLQSYVDKRLKIIGGNEQLVAEVMRVSGEVQLKIEQAFQMQREELYKSRFDTMLSFAEDSLKQATDFLVDWATGADVTFKDMANSIIRDMLRIIAQVHIIGPLMKSFTGFVTGGTESVISSALGTVFGFASGGIISEPVVGVGLNSGSGYAIAERGPEMVTPLGAGEGGGSGGGNNFNVTINAIDSQSVTELMRKNPQAITIPFIEAMQGGDRGLAASVRGGM